MATKNQNYSEPQRNNSDTSFKAKKPSDKPVGSFHGSFKGNTPNERPEDNN